MKQQQQPKHTTSQPNTPAQNVVLELAPNLNIHPDVLVGNGNGIFCCGAQGSGKSVALKLLLEQIGQKANIPLVAFDKEEDLLATVGFLPRGVIGTYNNCPTARDIYNDGLQVIYDLSTWPNLDTAGSMIARLVQQLMREAEFTPFPLRVPLLVALDEASYWLPEKRGEYLAPAVFAALYETFEALASRGRKRGVTPALFTQKFALIAKEVLSPGTYIFMRQPLHTEQQRYLDYILPVGEFAYYNDRQKKLRIGDLKQGEAIVKLATGDQLMVQFHECQSPHIAHTPRTSVALKRYANTVVSTTRYGAYIEDEAMEVETTSTSPHLPQVLVDVPKTKTRSTKTEKVRSLLREDRNLTVGELARRAGCSHPVASRVRARFLAAEPES